MQAFNLILVLLDHLKMALFQLVHMFLHESHLVDLL